MAAKPTASDPAPTLSRAERNAGTMTASQRLQRFAATLSGEQGRTREERDWLRTMIDQVPDYLYI